MIFRRLSVYLIVSCCKRTECLKDFGSLGHMSKHFSTSTTFHRSLKLPSSPPENTSSDWIGPPDSDSNIRPYVFAVPENESTWEREYREQREATLQWNHKYWSRHNRKFFTEKAAYIERHSTSNKQMTAEQLSEFYRKFLDAHYKQHRQYNIEWYKRNISLLWPAFKALLVKILDKR